MWRETVFHAVDAFFVDCFELGHDLETVPSLSLVGMEEAPVDDVENIVGEFRAMVKSVELLHPLLPRVLVSSP